MALQAYTDGYSQSIGTVEMQGSWDGAVSGNFGNETFCFFQWGYGSFGSNSSQFSTQDVSGSFTRNVPVDRDKTIKFRTKIDDSANNGTAIGASSGDFKTFADLATAGVPIVSGITTSGADVSCTFNANVVTSIFSVVLQYRRFGDTAWTTLTPEETSGAIINRSIAGLLGGVTYQVRLSGDRTTENDNTWTSTIVSFTTLQDTPTISTVAASSIAHNVATLNGVVDPNTVVGRRFFAWGLADGGAVVANWSNVTTLEAFSGDGNQSFDVLIAGLTSNTLYFFRAFAQYPSPMFPTTISGSTLSFTTAIDPQVVAPLEEHMHIYNYDGHYGVQTDFYFTLQSPSGTSSDRLVTTAPGSLFVAGDVKVSKDGGAFANASNSVTQVAASNPLYKLVLTAAEMQAELIMVQIVDQNGPAFRDAIAIVRTKQRLGQLFVRADQIGGSASAIIGRPSSGGFGLDILDSAGTGVGSIRGLFEGLVLRAGTCQAGGASTATLDSGASGTNSYYNGDILMLLTNTGAGQSRVIIGYDGTTKIATLNSSWSVNPDSTTRFAIVSGARALEIAQAELASVPASGSAAGLKLQLIFQRFAFKVDQTATTQRLFKADSSTVLGTRSVSDDGTTQQIAKVT